MRSPTGTTPYALIFGYDTVLPLEINVRSLRVQEQHQLIGEDYVQAMWQEHNDLAESRIAALDSLVVEKKRVSKAYDKRTRGLSFKEGELVWKAILPLGARRVMTVENGLPDGKDLSLLTKFSVRGHTICGFLMGNFIPIPSMAVISRNITQVSENLMICHQLDPDMGATLSSPALLLLNQVVAFPFATLSRTKGATPVHY